MMTGTPKVRHHLMAMASFAALLALYGLLGTIGAHSGARVITGVHRPVHLVRGHDEDRFRFQHPREFQRRQHDVDVVADERHRVGDDRSTWDSAAIAIR